MITDNIPYHPGKFSILPNDTIRIKVTNKCQFKCYFCHHEGTNESIDLTIDESLKQFLIDLKLVYNYKQIHLTGGEPTLFDHFFDFIGFFKSQEYQVKMTTNGQFEGDYVPKLYDAGLDGINFSIHTLNPIKLASIQKPRKSIIWGIEALKSQLTNLLKARDIGLNAKLNTVIQNDTSVLDIINFCKDENIQLRILDDLNPDSLSINKIIDTLKGLGAVIKKINFYNGSSSYSYDVIALDGFEFKIKAIRKYTLKTLCDDCFVRDVCKEWYYGIRIEQQKENTLVRLCLERQDYPAVQSLKQFQTSKQFDEIKEITSTNKNEN